MPFPPDFLMDDPTTAKNLWVDNHAANALVQRLSILDPRRRQLVAIAGAPGSGKSTFATYLEGVLNKTNSGSAAIVPMDGFHFDDAVLGQQNASARKGAPFTFDIGGMAATLRRLKENVEPQVAVPVFDRSIEISRAGGRLIPQKTPIVLVEGNYRLLDIPP